METIIQIPLLNSKQQLELNRLINKCNGYEPFFLCDDEAVSNDAVQSILQFAAFNDSGEMTGFLSCIYDCNTPEITALVAPDMRCKGIFSRMLAMLKNVTGSSFMPVAAISQDIYPALEKSSLAPEYAYSEYLMQINMPDNLDLYDCNSNISSLYEFYFSEDDSEYLMYEARASEPVAVCSLDYQPSFTNIAGVCVEESFRRRGLGTIFMHSLIYDYFTDDTRPLILNVTSTNIPAVSLYKKCGFTISDRVNYYYI